MTFPYGGAEGSYSRGNANPLSTFKIKASLRYCFFFFVGFLFKKLFKHSVYTFLLLLKWIIDLRRKHGPADFGIRSGLGCKTHDPS